MTRVVHCKKSPYDVYIGRPSKWGNPFTHLKHSRGGLIHVATRKLAVIGYKIYLRKRPDLVRAAVAELKGKVLGCWCKPLSCHGDILAAIADSEDDILSTVLADPGPDSPDLLDT